MRNKNSVTIGTALTVLITFTFLILFSQLISFGVCYLTGIIAKITIGKFLVDGFALLNITIPLDKIPLLAGTLGWIGSFFKSTINSKNKSSDN